MKTLLKYSVAAAVALTAMVSAAMADVTIKLLTKTTQANLLTSLSINGQRSGSKKQRDHQTGTVS